MIQAISQWSPIHSKWRNRHQGPLVRKRAATKRLPIRQCHSKRWPLCQWRFSSQFDFLKFSLMQSLGFGTAILEPDLHLSLCKREWAGKLSTLSNRQVLLLVEFVLKCQQLSCGKRCAWFAVGLVLTQCAQWTHLPCGMRVKNRLLFYFLLGYLINHRLFLACIFPFLCKNFSNMIKQKTLILDCKDPKLKKHYTNVWKGINQLGSCWHNSCTLFFYKWRLTTRTLMCTRKCDYNCSIEKLSLSRASYRSAFKIQWNISSC